MHPTGLRVITESVHARTRFGRDHKSAIVRAHNLGAVHFRTFKFLPGMNARLGVEDEGDERMFWWR